MYRYKIIKSFSDEQKKFISRIKELANKYDKISNS